MDRAGNRRSGFGLFNDPLIRANGERASTGSAAVVCVISRAILRMAGLGSLALTPGLLQSRYGSGAPAIDLSRGPMAGAWEPLSGTVAAQLAICGEAEGGFEFGDGDA